MTIELHPPGLRNVWKDPKRQKGLRHRTGVVTCAECASPSNKSLFAGPLLEVIAAALAHDKQHGEAHHITIIEDSCSIIVGH